jgi:hypothetical protein
MLVTLELDGAGLFVNCIAVLVGSDYNYCSSNNKKEAESYAIRKESNRGTDGADNCVNANGGICK